MADIHLTHRSLHDLEEIYDYSLEQWGEKVAESYLDQLENALALLGRSPDLLRSNARISDVFTCYKVERHWLICDRVDEDIYILTIKHVSMDLLERLNELQPALEHEARVLSRTLKG